MPDIQFNFREGGGSEEEILFGRVEIKTTLVHSRGTSLVLTKATTWDIIDGLALATNVQPTPEPVDGQIEWAYEVTAHDRKGGKWQWLVGVPNVAGTVEFVSLPRYFETKPPLFGQGPKGEPGEAATIAVGTVSEGITAEVTNSGTPNEAVFDFVLPKGEKGDTGAGVPVGGTALQVIRKDASGTTTEWATLTKGLVGLGNVDNTSDVSKPVSTPQKTYIDQSNTLAYRARTASAGASTYPEGTTTFLGSFTDGFPAIPGGSAAFSIITTHKPRSYTASIQYASPYTTGTVGTPNTGAVLYRVGTNDDAWGEWQTIATSRDNYFSNARSFGAVGDGVTNDTVALQSLVDSAYTNTKTAYLELGKTYVISGAVGIPEGVTLEGNNSTILIPSVYGSTAFSLQGNNSALRNVKIVINTSLSDNTRGIAATGRTNVTLDNVSIEATNPAAGAGNMNRTGVSFTDCSEVYIKNLRVKNFDYPTAFVRCSRVDYTGGLLETFVRGLYMTEIKNSSFRDIVIQGMSPNSLVKPGHNGVLIGTETVGGTDGLLFDNITVDTVGEHGFRIGAFITIRNVKHINCKSINAGASGFKVLGGQTGGTSYHEDISYDNCIAIDSGNITNMTAGFMVQFVRRARVTNCTVAKRNKTYSAAYGVEFQAVDGIIVSNPMIRDTENAGIKMGFVLGDITDVTIDGGTVTNSSGHSIWFDFSNRTMRRVKVTGFPTLTTSGTGYNIHLTNGTSGTAVGSCLLSWYSTQSSSNQVSPESATVAFTCDARAAFDSVAMSSKFRNGSIWVDQNLTTGQTYYRVGSTWKTPVYA